MGAAEGGVMPISHSMIARAVAPQWRGVAQGIGQNLGSSLLGAFVAPILLVWIARHYGWQPAFYLAGVPGILTALLIWRFIDEPDSAPRPARAQAERAAGGGFLSALANRNVLICVFMGVMLVAYIVICWAFLPLYLTQVRGYAPETMSWFLGTLGVAAAFSSFTVPAVSDRIGRRPVVVAMSLASAILPLAALYFTGPDLILAVLFFFSWMKNGILPLLMATIPSESVDPRLAATALGIGMGSSELLGGVFSPSLAGMVADATDLSAPLWIMVVLSVAAALAGLLLTETAPRRIAAR
jgi:predicted MFS family arabinose efflux permease